MAALANLQVATQTQSQSLILEPKCGPKEKIETSPKVKLSRIHHRLAQLVKLIKSHYN